MEEAEEQEEEASERKRTHLFETKIVTICFSSIEQIDAAHACVRVRTQF